jgi:hypothetical protein
MSWTERVLPEPNSGCWLWTGRYGNQGYGTYGGGRRGERVQAHRLVWEVTNGPIPTGLFVLHRCDVRGCVNPAHLFLGTAKDNTRDMMAKGRAHFVGGLHNSRKTHCKYGHPFVPERTSISRKGARVCLECARLRESGKRRAKGIRGLPKTHCKHRHAFIDGQVNKRGHRICLECRRISSRTCYANRVRVS